MHYSKERRQKLPVHQITGAAEHNKEMSMILLITHLFYLYVLSSIENKHLRDDSQNPNLIDITKPVE